MLSTFVVLSLVAFGASSQGLEQQSSFKEGAVAQEQEQEQKQKTWAPLLCQGEWCAGVRTQGTMNASLMLMDVAGTVSAVGNAVLSTFATSSGDINSRVVSPKPLVSFDLANATSKGLAVVYVDTNNLSRKYKEIQAAGTAGARVNLIYSDASGVGYVALRGKAVICGSAEAKREYWQGWNAFYPQGSNTSFYSLIRIEPDWVEFVSVARFDVQSGRTDWAPPSLARANGVWKVETPAPYTPPTPGPPASKKWVCSVCAHVYDPAKDGNGLPFEKLPDTWKCPVCGAPKSAYHQTTNSEGQVQWVHDDVH